MSHSHAAPSEPMFARIFRTADQSGGGAAVATPPATPAATPDAPLNPTVVTPPGAPAPSGSMGVPTYAGKYQGPEALERATREITESLGLPKLPDGPLFGPGKQFADVMALEADYKAKESLQGRLGNAKKEAAAAETPPATPLKPGEMPKIQPPATPAATTDDLDNVDYGQVLTKAGLTEEQVATEWKEGNGKLKDETYAKLKTAGWGRKIVDRFIGAETVSREATVGRVMQEIDTLSGGPEKTATLVQWAGTHYGAAEVEDLNKRLGSTLHAVAAMKQIMFDHARVVGSSGSRPLVNGSGPAQTTTAGYTSGDDYRKALERVRSGTATAEDRARIANTDKNLALR